MPTPSPKNEIEALEHNLWAQWSQFGAPDECTYQWDDEICQLETPIPSFPYNGVLKFTVAAGAETRVKKIVRHFDSRGVKHFGCVIPVRRRMILAGCLKRTALPPSMRFKVWRSSLQTSPLT